LFPPPPPPSEHRGCYMIKNHVFIGGSHSPDRRALCSGEWLLDTGILCIRRGYHFVTLPSKGHTILWPPHIHDAPSPLYNDRPLNLCTTVHVYTSNFNAKTTQPNRCPPKCRLPNVMILVVVFIQCIMLYSSHWAMNGPHPFVINTSTAFSVLSTTHIWIQTSTLRMHSRQCTNVTAD
jgi:hypothetical protein